MNVVNVKCDDPNCGRIGEPEDRNAKGMPTRPPYGWLTLKGHAQGTLTTFTITVCSSKCTPGAIEAEADRQLGDR